MKFNFGITSIISYLISWAMFFLMRYFAYVNESVGSTFFYLFFLFQLITLIFAATSIIKRENLNFFLVFFEIIFGILSFVVVSVFLILITNPGSFSSWVL